MNLSILDFSPIMETGSGTEAVRNTVRLAKEADCLGYKRFWVSEHHNSTFMAGSSPEVLIGHLTACTKKIRLGSGGIMLPYYSPYKVAENFLMLEALAPGRIDLGVGKAPGGSPIASMALNYNKDWDSYGYEEQIDRLSDFLSNNLTPEHPFYGIKAVPEGGGKPEIWMLGSGRSSAEIAAVKGLPLNFAHFLNPIESESVITEYKKMFKKNHPSLQPKVILTLFAVCADTSEEADKVARSSDLHFLLIRKGKIPIGVSSVETAARYRFTDEDKSIIEANRKKMLIGTPSQIKMCITSIFSKFNIDEIMLASLSPDLNHRIQTIKLIATEFKMSVNSPANKAN
jgi:luciferase family oxidoreductase group 1